MPFLAMAGQRTREFLDDARTVEGRKKDVAFSHPRNKARVIPTLSSSVTANNTRVSNKSLTRSSRRTGQPKASREFGGSEPGWQARCPSTPQDYMRGDRWRTPIGYIVLHTIDQSAGTFTEVGQEHWGVPGSTWLAAHNNNANDAKSTFREECTEGSARRDKRERRNYQGGS